MRPETEKIIKRAIDKVIKDGEYLKRKDLVKLLLDYSHVIWNTSRREALDEVRTVLHNLPRS